MSTFVIPSEAALRSTRDLLLAVRPPPPGIIATFAAYVPAAIRSSEISRPSITAGDS